MLIPLISFILFSAIYYAVWTLWCRYAGTYIVPNGPQWVKRPSLFTFFFVTLVVLLLYKSMARK